MATPPPKLDRIWVNAQLATLDPQDSAPYGTLERHALGVRGEAIGLIAPMSDLDLAGFQGEVIDVAGKWVTPGLIDCHTHLVWGGSRAREWEMRLSGVPYAEIARQGGGILVHRARDASAKRGGTVSLAIPRLRALMAEGITCVEIKSGYGLTLPDEIKMLRVARRLAETFPVEISPTLLAAHAVPPEFAGVRGRLRGAHHRRYASGGG